MNLIEGPVLFALRTASAGLAEQGLTRWAKQAPPHSLFVSALTLHEFENQAAQAALQDRNSGARWRIWLDSNVARAFDGRVVPVDADVVRRAATLDYADPRDGLLAATALEHSMTLVTFRPRAFRNGRVKTFDPTGYVPVTSTEDWRQAARGAPVWIKSLFVRS